jgi:hypothetical protein
MPDQVFYERGMAPRRFGALIVPLRRILRRLERPWFDRQVEIFDELRAAIDAAEARIAAAERTIETLGTLAQEVRELRDSLRAEEARSWDQSAIARRLAALEDRISE